MGSKHTPGPWGIASSSGDYSGYWIEAKGWGRIIRCEDQSNEAPANAALIASAPALLAALEGLLDQLDGIGIPEWHGAEGLDLDEARKVLAAVKGGR